MEDRLDGDNLSEEEQAFSSKCPGVKKIMEVCDGKDSVKSGVAPAKKLQLSLYATVRVVFGVALLI